MRRSETLRLTGYVFIELTAGFVFGIKARIKRPVK